MEPETITAWCRQGRIPNAKKITVHDNGEWRIPASDEDADLPDSHVGPERVRYEKPGQGPPVANERENRDWQQGISLWQHKNGRWYADSRKLPGGKRETLGTADRIEAEDREEDSGTEWLEIGEAATVLYAARDMVEDSASR